MSHGDGGALPPFLKLSSKNRRGDVECDAGASVNTRTIIIIIAEVKINMTHRHLTLAY